MRDPLFPPEDLEPLAGATGPSLRRDPAKPIASRPRCCLPAGKVASSGMADQSLSEQAREAVLQAIIKSAPNVGNSPAGVRDLAEAYALLERDLVPNAGVVHSRT
jgi:hypothetical protein